MVIEHIDNGEKGSSVRAKLNAIIDSLGIKIDNAVYEGNYLRLYADGVMVKEVLMAQGSKMVLRSNKLAFSTAYGKQSFISFTFSSCDSNDGVATGDGVGTLTVNGKVVQKGIKIPQTDQQIQVTDYLRLGDNTCILSVTDTYSLSRSITFTITAVQMSITSAFDATKIFTSDIAFGFRPYGQFEKSVVFEVDGQKVASITTSQNDVLLTQTISRQTHGEHILQVYMIATIDGVSVQSNVLRYALICTQEGDTTPIIASAYDALSVGQYSTIVLPYMVYTPGADTSRLELWVNGSQVSTLSVDSSLQYWNRVAASKGELKLKIVSGVASKEFTIQVTQSEITSEAVSENLSLWLSSAQRSNSETNKDEWSYTSESGESIKAEMSGFNWSTNGWVADKNNNSTLRISSPARVSVPLKIFEKESAKGGLCVEFDFVTRDVKTDSAELISCFAGNVGLKIMPRETLFRSTITEVRTNFKEEERIRISFVVKYLPADEGNGIKETALIMTYINGIISGCQQYTSSIDSFRQSEPVAVSIGSDECTIDLYNIRVYSTYLTDSQVLDNYIADLDDINMKLACFRQNAITDQYGELDYQKLLKKIPILTITGDLPQYKGDKKTVSLKYELNSDDTTNEEYQPFVASGVQIDVQGTSSQYYPRKNYKIKCKKGFTINPNDNAPTNSTKYELRKGKSLAVNTFCLKADFAESSGVHNTGTAKLVDRVLRGMNYLTPPQKDEANADKDLIRTTIDGYPIIVYWAKSEADTPTFLGKYNFNNDKSTANTFGFSGEPDATSGISPCECWEFLSNQEDICSFLSNDFSTILTDDKGNKYPKWTNALEARYPDLDSPYRNTSNIKVLWDWVVSTNPKTATGNALAQSVTYNDVVYTQDTAEYRLAKFKAEAKEHFNIDFLVFYYVMTELLAMVDQRAKNLFLASWGNEGEGDWKWYPIFYDNDTICGLDNVGRIMFGYNVEYHSTKDNAPVFAGEESVLWNNVEQCFQNEIEALYKNARQKNLLSYAVVEDIYNTQQSDKWAEIVYNKDANFKYISPAIYGYTTYEDGTESKKYTSEYLYEAQGSRAEQRKWWLSNRFNYMDSKYLAGAYNSDYFYARFYSPTQNVVVEASYDWKIMPKWDGYFTAKWDDIVVRKIGKKGEALSLPYPNSVVGGGQPVVALYGVSKLSSMGDLSPKYPHTVFDLSKATDIEDLTVGNTTQGYQNTRLTYINIGAKPYLRSLNVANLTALAGVLNLAECPLIETIIAPNTKIGALALPKANNIKNIDIKNCSSFIQALDLSNCSTLSSLIVEGSGITSLALPLGNSNISVMNVKNCPNITDITIRGSQYITSIQTKGSGVKTISLLNCAGLETFDCSDNANITTINLSGTKSIKNLIVYLNAEGKNTTITSLNISDCTQLEDFDFNALTALQELIITNCTQIKTLDISKLTALKTIDFSNTAIKELNISNNQNIVNISCAGLEKLIAQNSAIKQITNIDSGLKSLDITATAITVLDLSNANSLSEFLAQESKIETLTLPYNDWQITDSTKITLPNTITTLISKGSTLLNSATQAYYSAFVAILPTLTHLWLGVANPFTLVRQTIKLTHLRLEGINVVNNDSDVSDLLNIVNNSLAGIDQNSAEVQKAQLIGTYYVAYGSMEDKTKIKDYFGSQFVYTVGQIIAFISFAKEYVANAMSEMFGNNDGKLSYQQASAVTDDILQAKFATYVNKYFSENSKIDYFNEFQYFTGITHLVDNLFAGNPSLKEITLPANLQFCNEKAFYYCQALEKISFATQNNWLSETQETVEPQLEWWGTSNSMSDQWKTLQIFSYCIALKELDLSTLTKIHNIRDDQFNSCSLEKITLPVSNNFTMIRSGFKNNKSGKSSITLVTYNGNNNYHINSDGTKVLCSAFPPNVDTIMIAFLMSNNMKGIVLHEHITSISGNAFKPNGDLYGSKFVQIDMNANGNIKNNPFVNNNQLNAIHFTSQTPPLLVCEGTVNLISYMNNIKAIVVSDETAKTNYKNASTWQTVGNNFTNSTMYNALGKTSETCSPAMLVITEAEWETAKTNGYLVVTNLTDGTTSHVSVAKTCEDI